MNATLTPYLPRLAVEWDLDAPGRRWREIDGTCCFVDISGFTALSERLARRGRIGAEELTDVLNHVFSRMLAVAYEKGGNLLKFGGDALLLAFLTDDHAVLAAQAAVAMRAELRAARTFPTSVGRLNLRMSVGVHSGTFDFFRVGHSHRELLVVGPAATATTLMEHTADAGQIVVSAATAALLPASATGAAKGDGLLLRWRAIAPGGPPMREAQHVDEDEIAGGVPVALRRHLGQGGSESEHRVASVGFLKFRGVDDYLAAHGPAATAEALDEIVTAAQRAADAENVTFLASDIDANGGKLILVAGVPLAQDDDEGRMLRVARAILDHEFALPVCIGVNCGHVFAGEIGTDFRRTFTVMGDTVNLAARLMAAAPSGRLYATANVLSRSRTLFATETLEPFHVKGKTHPVQAYAVGAVTGARGEELSSLPFAGRGAEIAGLEADLAAAIAGRGSVTVVEGDRGAGKSRLLHELVARCDAEVLTFQGEAFATAVPYFALREPLRTLLGIDATDPVVAGSQLAEAVVAMAPHSASLAPLLAPVLDVELPPTPESAAIAPEFHRDRLGDLLVVLLHAQPVARVLLVDDAQWIDDASAGVLERVVAGSGGEPWMFVVTRRPVDGGFRPAPADTIVTLGPIDDATARDVVDEVTASAPLRPEERDRLVARAAGNPLFLEELLRVASTGSLDELPETLDAVATREIDSLPPAARAVVRYASVLGRVFDRELLNDLVGDEAFDDTMARQLSTCLVAHGDRLEFRHALLQEAAYESLAFRRRVELHRRAGEALLRIQTRDGEATEALLSLHFSRAQDWERTWIYARIAGRRAAAAYAPAEAATHLERAITAARRLGDVAVDDIVELLTELGAALVTMGVYDRADDAYRRAAAAARHDALRRARLAERRAYVQGEHQGRLTAAIRHARAGLALLDAVPDPGDDATRIRAQLVAREAEMRFRQGRLDEAARLCGEVMVSAEMVGEYRALGTAMSVLDACLFELGRAEEANHTLQALELYERLGDRGAVAGALCNLATMSFLESRWKEASERYMRAAEAATEAGDLALAAVSHANLGELRINQGRVEEAEAVLVPALRTLRATGAVPNIVVAALQLGRARAFLGTLDEGVALLLDAATMSDDIRALVGSVEARARIAEVNAFAGRIDAAAAALDDARAISRPLDDTPLGVLLDRVDVTVAVVAGEDARATARLAEAIPRARAQRAQYDLLLLLTLADRIGTGDHARERAEIASDLGVVALVPLAACDRP